MKKAIKNTLAIMLCSLSDMILGFMFTEIGLYMWTGDWCYSYHWLDTKMLIGVYICCYLRRATSIITNKVVEGENNEV